MSNKEFSKLLQSHLQERGIGTEKLAQLTSVSRQTIVGWLRGRQPRDWRSIVHVAIALNLDREKVDTLLHSAGQPYIANLAFLPSLTTPERDLIHRLNSVNDVAPRRLSARVPNADHVPELRLCYTDRPNGIMEQINFYWSDVFGNGSVYVEVRTRADAYWISSREILPNPKLWGLYPHPGPNGISDALAAALGVLIGDILEIGIGAGSQLPIRQDEPTDLQIPASTRLYQVTRRDVVTGPLEMLFLSETIMATRLGVLDKPGGV